MAQLKKAKRSKRMKSELDRDRGEPQAKKTRKHPQSDYDYILAADYEEMEKNEDRIYRRAEEIINRA
jgi:hypothetical protein